VEENDVVADDGDAGVIADVWPELIAERVVGDSAERFANLLDEGNGAAGIVFGDPVGDGFEVGFNKAGKFEAHYSDAPAASAMA